MPAKFCTRSPRPACFKSYDIRGRIGIELDTEMAFRVGTAFAKVMTPRHVVLGHDCRESSPSLSKALAQGLLNMGVDILDIGLAGTEEVYFATAHLGADGGIEVTASHNPIDYNGMKLVGPGSRPLTEEEFAEIGDLAGAGLTAAATLPNRPRGIHLEVDVRKDYSRHIVGLIDVDSLPAARILVDAGNGVAGSAFDSIAEELAARGASLDVVRICHAPDGGFPNGIPNPLLPENRPRTAEAVRRERADIGIAWDGDFDRCFLFDHSGRFVDGEYVVGLLAAAFLKEAPSETIVHDPRVVWNTTAQVETFGGQSVVSKTGHAHVKRVMRESGAIYGGEMSAHHYFRDFMCCDSGMIPWLKTLELIGRTGMPLADLVGGMARAYPSSGERNFRVEDTTAAITALRDRYAADALEVDTIDGLSLSFETWRMNIRQSSTEPLLRLNIETRGDRNLLKKVLADAEASIAACQRHDGDGAAKAQSA